MTHFLVSEENPNGHKLEDLLNLLRAEILKRSTLIAYDDRPEARHVLSNNTKILSLITDAIDLARDSTHILDRSFGPSRPGKPRIGGE